MSSFYMTINGKRVEAHEGDMVLDVTRRVGIDVPTLCEHKAVEPFGSCRLCMVEVTKPAWKGWKGLMTACLYPAAPELIITTDSQRVREVRRTVLDLLLARCPHAAPIQQLAAEYGVTQTSFTPREDADNCILCGLCTRICESAATAAITTIKRGHDREVGTPWGGPPPDCIGCLACAHICPTGHIEYADEGRSRTIWGQTFEFARCTTCGKPLPITTKQVEFLMERQQLDQSYFARCEVCQRKETAAGFGRMAHWQQLGFNQEEVGS